MAKNQNSPKEDKENKPNPLKTGGQPIKQSGGSRPPKPNKPVITPKDTQLHNDIDQSGVSFSTENQPRSGNSSGVLDFPASNNAGSISNQSINSIRDGVGGFAPFAKFEFVKWHGSGQPLSPMFQSAKSASEQLLNILRSKTHQPTSTTTTIVTSGDIELYFDYQVNHACFAWSVAFVYGLTKRFDDRSMEVPYAFANSINQGAVGNRFNSSTIPAINNLARALYICKNTKEAVSDFFGCYQMCILEDGVSRFKVIMPLINLEQLSGGKEFNIPSVGDKPAEKRKLPKEWSLTTPLALVEANIFIRDGLASVNFADPRVIAVKKVQNLIDESLNFVGAREVYRATYDLEVPSQYSAPKILNDRINVFEINRDTPLLKDGSIMHTNVVAGNAIALYAAVGTKVMPVDFVISSQYAQDPASKAYVPLVGFCSNASTSVFLGEKPTEWFCDNAIKLAFTNFDNEIATFNRKLRLSSTLNAFRVTVNYDRYSLWKYDISNIPSLCDDWFKHLFCITEMNALERP